MFYRSILKPIFFRFDPEIVHDFMTSFGEFLGKFFISRKLVELFYGYRGNKISKIVDGIHYKSPFLLSAGFDYNGRLINILPCIGLGGAEIGSVTAKRCEGNDKPRLIRLPKSRSILVNKGLKNDGVDKVIERLKKYKKTDFIVGISIAKTNCADTVTIEDAIEDYLYSFKKLNENNIGNYYTINISCPNAYGGEAFITPDLLTKLVSALKDVPCNKPVYVKMPINIPWEQFLSLLQVIDRYGLNGVVIGNLNKNYEDLDYRYEAPEKYSGGLSGKVCRKLSTELIRKTKEIYGSRFTIIGVGGVMSLADAKEKISAGADLIQLITGIIYEGPGLIKKLCKGISK